MNPDPKIEPERYELHAEPFHEFEVDRRDFFKLLGGGLVVCLLLDGASGQDRDRGGRGGRRGGVSQELSAWIHLNESGQVTVFTGKAEVGQNIRTSLSQVVAEELRLPVSEVRLVMADTELTPFDAGTFGSRTTPSMAPQLRRAAAVAREMLLDLAAERAQVDRSTLVVEQGTIRHEASGRSFSFGALSQGRSLTRTITADAPMTPASAWRIIGTSVPKVDGRAIVTGQHVYASDMTRPGMLYGRILRPPTLTAELASADLKEAEGLPGVSVVRDGSLIGVAASSSQQAERALQAIRAEWRVPAGPSDRTLFADLKKGSEVRARGPAIEQGLAAADHRIEATYTIAYIAHAPLEPRAALAEWQDGKLTVWTGTQRPFGVRDELASAFHLPPERVRVIVPDTGSGYGGKHSGEVAVEAARLAKAAGRPVKLVWTREEEFTWAYYRPAGVIDVAAGIKSDGTLTAWDFHNYNSGGSGLRIPYEVTHQETAFHAARSPLRQGSYRALAATANHFARESHLDDLARAIQVDPLALRLQLLTEPRMRAVLDAAASRFGWGRSKPGPDHGFGLAVGEEKGGHVATCAEIAVDREQGQVRVIRLVTAFDCGAVVNPEHLKNQVEGAVVMGLGGALFERIQYDGGRILNPRFSRYRVPRFRDVPDLETVLVDSREHSSAGAGETPIVTVAPAIGNAIFQATGVRLRSLPMVPQGWKT